MKIIIFFLPSFILFTLRTIYISGTVSSLSNNAEQTGWLSKAWDAFTSIIDPYSMTSYLYGINQVKHSEHIIIYCIIVLFSIIIVLIPSESSCSFIANSDADLLNTGRKLMVNSLVLAILFFLAPLSISIHHYQNIIFPLLVGVSFIFMSIENESISNQYKLLSKRIIIISFSLLFAANLVLNIAGINLHIKNQKSGNYSSYWNNEIYSLSGKISDILSNPENKLTLIYNGWGFMNQIESLNASFANKHNFSSYESYDGITADVINKALSKNDGLQSKIEKINYLSIVSPNLSAENKSICRQGLQKIINSASSSKYMLISKLSVSLEKTYICTYELSS